MRTRAVANRPKQHKKIQITRQRAAETISTVAPEEMAERADHHLVEVPHIVGLCLASRTGTGE